MTIPAELIGPAEEVPVDKTVRDIYSLYVMAAPSKCVSAFENERVAKWVGSHAKMCL